MGAPPNVVARLTIGRRRHAEHYLSRLAAADDLYAKGGENVLSGLRLFDRERRNIEAGQAWATENAANDVTAARLCVRYPYDGTYVLSLRHHPRQRITWLDTAVGAARQIKDQRGESNALNILGLAYRHLGETGRSIEHHEQALAIARQAKDKDKRGECNILNNLGLAYRDCGEFERAIEHHEEALKIAQDIKYRTGEGNALGNIGLSYVDLGKPDRAIDYYQQVLGISRQETGDRKSESTALANLGLAYVELGKIGIAIQFYEQSLSIAQDMKDLRGEGSALYYLGTAYATLGDKSRAVDLLYRALEIFERIDNPRAAETLTKISALEVQAP
jgi:tetratricopeptide (TPR) repeat protein